MTAHRWRVLQAAKRRAARWRRLRGVVGIGIGQRHRDGHWVDESCVVVKVLWKLGPAQLRAGRQRPLPEWITVTVDGRSAKVRVDVQETAGASEGERHGIVGAAVRDGQRVIGSLSAVVVASGTPALLVSGHVADHARRRLGFGALSGLTGEPVCTRRLDHCLVDVDALPAKAGELIDDSTLVGIRAVADLDLGETLYFQRAATGARVAVALRHVDMEAPFWTPGGTLTMQGLLATERRSVPGDSGTLLYDAEFRAVGTLVGGFGSESYFVPCDYAFKAMGLQLA